MIFTRRLLLPGQTSAQCTPAGWHGQQFKNRRCGAGEPKQIFRLVLSHARDYSNLIRRIIRNPAGRREFQKDIFTRNVQTNVADRGKGPKLLAMYYAERFGGRPLRILDVGCGQNHLLKKLVITQLPFVSYSPVTVNKPCDDGINNQEVDSGLTRSFNKRLETDGLVLGKCIGIDKEPNKRKG